MYNFLKRYWRTKGFGIHSPFAFRFVTEVVDEKLDYYDYIRLPQPWQRLVFRVACHFQPASIYAADSADALAASLACPKAAMVAAADASMVVSGPMEPEDISRAIELQAVVMMHGCNRKYIGEVHQILDQARCGMTFENGLGSIIVVPSRKLPRQDFHIRF